MLDLSDPRSWTDLTNWTLVAVSFVAASILGLRSLIEKRVHRMAKVRSTLE
jgi:hypothetical protein